MIMLEGYKIVKNTDVDGVYTSCVIRYPSAATYKINKIAIPKKGNGPLAVFDTLDNVFKFLEMHLPATMLDEIYSVFKCKYEPAEGNMMWKDELADGTMMWCDRQIRLGAKDYVIHDSVAIDELPPGTKLAASLILKEKIPMEDILLGNY